MSSSQTGRIADNLSFLRQTLNPREVHTRPPPLQHPVSLYKSVTLENKFSISPIADTDDNVKNDTGLVLWLTEDGVANIVHYGIVPADAQWPPRTSPVLPFDGVQSMVSGDTAWAIPTVGSDYGIERFIFEKALAIPRIDEERLASNPNLAKDFSLSRGFGGRLRMRSATTNTNVSVLNGYLTTAVISDTRDLAQNEPGTDCFSTIELGQAARTTKEVVRNVEARHGVVTLQGPDIPSRYTQPNGFAIDTVNGGWQEIASTFAPIQRTVDVTDHTFQPLFAIWASPWGVQNQEYNSGSAYSSGSTFGISGPAVNIQPVSENCCLDVSLDYNCHTTAGGSTAEVNITHTVEWYFASVSNSQSGQIEIKKITKQVTRSMGVAAIEWVGGLGQAFQTPGYRVDEVISPADDYYSKGGIKFWGKLMGVRVGAQAYISVTATGSNCDFKTNIVSCKVRARDLFSDGATGPCHVIRYDDLGEGQNVIIDGWLNTENVAKGNLAPYVQNGIMYSNYDADANIYPLLYALYNGPSVNFKCSWDGEDYLRFIGNSATHITIDSLSQLAQDTKEVSTGAEAAGLFSGLGGLLGSGIGSMLGDGQAGGQIGSVIGGLGDALTGGLAAGQFGGGAAGQFGGESMGQFGGDSMGQFGGLSAGHRRTRSGGDSNYQGGY